MSHLLERCTPSASEFTSDQIARDVELTSRLEADTHILAATDNIPGEVADKAKQLTKERGLSLVILGKLDLLPWG